MISSRTSNALLLLAMLSSWHGWMIHRAKLSSKMLSKQERLLQIRVSQRVAHCKPNSTSVKMWWTALKGMWIRATSTLSMVGRRPLATNSHRTVAGKSFGWDTPLNKTSRARPPKEPTVASISCKRPKRRGGSNRMDSIIQNLRAKRGPRENLEVSLRKPSQNKRGL